MPRGHRRPRTRGRPEAVRRLFRLAAGALTELLVAARTGEIALGLLRPRNDFLQAALHSRAEQAVLAAALEARHVPAVESPAALPGRTIGPIALPGNDTPWTATGDAFAATEMGAFLAARGVP